MAHCRLGALIGAALVLHSEGLANTADDCIINPLTGREIRVGGPTFQKLLGPCVYHQGNLHPLDEQLLASGESLLENSQHPLWNVHDGEDWLCVEHNHQNNLLVVQKPAGLHCVPPKTPNTPNLVELVQEKYPKAKVCHRLDVDTSGLVCFGLTKKSHRLVSQAFENRRVKKTYHALIQGCPEPKSGRIETLIGKVKTPQGFNRWAIGGDKAREAVTEYNVEEVFAKGDGVWSRVALSPLTGRGHQLRLHMAYVGCPMLGDTLHAPAFVAQCAPRLCLHASSLDISLQRDDLADETLSFSSSARYF